MSLELRAGEFVALLGRSGSGKSTFLRVLGALDKEVEGYIRVQRRRAVVFHDPRLMPWLPVLFFEARGKGDWAYLQLLGGSLPRRLHGDHTSGVSRQEGDGPRSSTRRGRSASDAAYRG
ncbi:ATP-binding cassette domain-containing protein [Bradyrhizobium yuanmingense]|uniref:ATP-binding cassette domain-containing protein n=1 Tax=Bradyrhizobium yuanmingense TaxID=108015 RepID=UPI001CD7E44C|nr:ATP-binding cassette domain-containing protein [Bradyrhizobium yuanmingense]